VPDYLNDLNAMHEAETTLSWEHRKIFESHLGKIIRRDCADDVRLILWMHSHAAAFQRAEAFLKTLNLWENN